MLTVFVACISHLPSIESQLLANLSEHWVSKASILAGLVYLLAAETDQKLCYLWNIIPFSAAATGREDYGSLLIGSNSCVPV